MKVSLEFLESRRLLTAAAAQVPFTLIEPLIPVSVPVLTVTAHLTHTGTLLVEGTPGNDEITVSEPGSFDPWITLGGPDIFVNDVANFKLSAVKRIVVDAGAGKDDVLIDNALNLKTTLMGGKGNDTLVGGTASNVLSGGGGNDLLFAGYTTITAPNGTSTVYGYTSGLQPIALPSTPAFAVPTATSSVDEPVEVANFLEGGAGNDTLYAGNGPDIIKGDEGNDTLVTIGRGKTQPTQVALRRGNDQRSFDGLTFSSIEVIDVM